MTDRLANESLTEFDRTFRIVAGGIRAGEAGEAGDVGEGHAHEVSGDLGFAEAALAIDKQGSIPLSSGRLMDRQTIDSLRFRSWLFGVLTLLELRARDLIRRDPDWRSLISENRLDKAHSVKDERARRGRMMATVDALQFGDVGWLAVRYDGWYDYFGVQSKKAAKQLVKRLELLRNALAHSQDIVTHEWDTVLAVARSVVAIKKAEHAASP